MSEGGQPVDRADVVDAVEALLHGARSGRGSSLWIDGAPGSGRTAVVELALERARSVGLEARVAQGGGESSEPVVAAALAASGQGRSPKDDPTDLDAWLSSLRASSSHRPVLLAVDDVQRTDTPSARQLTSLVTRLPHLPVALLVAGRQLDDGEAELASLLHHPMMRCATLGPLDVDAARTLLRRTHPAPTPAFVTACHRASGGVPALLALLGRAALRAGLAADDEAAGQLDRGGLETLALDEVRRWASSHLARPVLHLAEAAAVLGDGASVEELCALVGLPPQDVLPALDTLFGAELLVPSARIAFRAPLLAASLHQGVRFGRRSQLHARAARLLHERGRGSGGVAGHLLATIPSGDVWAVDQLRHAAVEARTAGRHDAAERYLRRAIDEPAPADRRGQLRAELAEVAFAVGSTDAVRLAEDAVATACAATRASALLLAARARYRIGDLDGAIERLDEAAEDVADEDPRHVELGLLRTLVTRWRGVARSAEGHGPPASDLAADPLQEALAAVLAGRDPTRANRAASTALASHPRPDPVGLRHEAAIVVLLATGGAGAVVTELTSLLERADDPPRHGWWHAARAEARWRCGALQGAVDDARAAEHRVGGASVPPFVVSARCCAALSLLELDRLNEADTVLGPTPVGHGPVVGRWEAAHGRLAAARGDTAAALGAFTRCERLLVGAGSDQDASLEPWRPVAALAAAAAGQIDRARSWIEVEVAVAQRAGDPIRLGLAAWARGRLAEHPEERIQLLADACTQLAASPPSVDTVRAALDLGAELRRQGRCSLARAQLRSVLDTAHHRGFVRLARLAHEELLTSGARPRRAALTGPWALTPSETRIARLAASGRSNGEIATLLGVSRKTVEWHLGHVYLKLGVTGRADLSTVGLPELQSLAVTPG